MTDEPERISARKANDSDTFIHADFFAWLGGRRRDDEIEYIRADLYEARAAEIERLRGLLRAILDADERGQGQPFAEAMQKARALMKKEGE